MSKLRNERVWLFCDRVYWCLPRKFRIWLWYSVLCKTLCKLCRAGGETALLCPAIHACRHKPTAVWSPLPEIEWCEQVLMESTCRNSDGLMCEHYPCKFLKLLRGKRRRKAS